MQANYRRGLWAAGFFTILLALSGHLRAAHVPGVRELRTQRVGDATYFHVCLDAPVDMRAPRIEQAAITELQRRKLARLPQLISQDANTAAVYQRLEIPDYRPTVGFDPAAAKPTPIVGLEFVGKQVGAGKASLLLLYPVGAEVPNFAGEDPPSPETWARSYWEEVPLELDFAAAARIATPPARLKRQPKEPPGRDDLEGLWAEAQAGRLAILETMAPDFGYYGFACEATGRRYGVRAPMLGHQDKDNREKIYKQLYETTTGSAAITQSLAMQRLLEPRFRDDGQRVIDIWSVPAIDIAEHPWKKLMSGRKPAPEPLAALVPHDNFYVHFKSIARFIEFGDVLDDWGTNAIRAYEMSSRDLGLKERYEKQLCLRSSWLGKSFGPAVIRSLALTGSDGYLRDGSDLTVLFHLNNRLLFLSAVEQFLNEARRDFGKNLRETKADYHGIPVESYVTPLREVSLHRAVFGEFAVYSNSPTALRRVLDAHHGRLKSLADSLDFQYMRTVFRLDDAAEDGFAFLSDPFIRQLVAPASKIKAKRRLEALTSLHMVTHAALFKAWETGKKPTDSHRDLLAHAALKDAEVYTPEGRGVVWQPERQAAVSDVYNTLHFVTPLIELPIGSITRAEEQEYLEFRKEYLNLWRQFFDPVGVRIAFDKRRVRIDTYILPLIRDGSYDSLRNFAGEGTALLGPSRFTPKTLVQGTFHLSPLIRGQAEGVVFGGQGGVDNLGLIRVEDSPAFLALAKRHLREEMNPPQTFDYAEEERLTFRLPITAGIKFTDANKLRRATTENDKFPQLPDQRKVLMLYKNVQIVRLSFQPNLTLFHAAIGDSWYLSLSETALKELVDQEESRRANKNVRKQEEESPINVSLYVSPAAAVQAGEALRYYLEWQTHRRALLNNALWYPLYRGGLVNEKTSPAEKQAIARRYLGFLPVSPDNVDYYFDSKYGEVRHRRHDSLRMPVRRRSLAAESPLAHLIGDLQSIRADLRFREDGVHTVLTLERRERP